ncbi:MAG TPA: DUF169 domain-containing protein [Gemmataceae bacterium]|nr:DUF169 domain-containing protein [Gemmataceae bacterium]
MNTAQQLQDLLQLRTAPVAIAFQDTPPANLPHMAAAAPSGCTFWKHAAAGQAFYTEVSDHYNCPIGAYTHGVDLPPERAKELQDVVETMVKLDYLRLEEVPGIPRRQGKLGVVLYAPLATAPFEPEVVVVCGNAKQIMLLAEAAQAAGVGAEAPLMGRPTCAAVPTVLQTQHSAASLGCIGNRVYTEMADDELYFALPGGQLGRMVEKLAAIVNANRELEKYHRAKLATIGV